MVNKVLLRYRGPDGSVETLEVVDRLSCQLAEASDFAMTNCREENGSTVIFSTDPETFESAVYLFRLSALGEDKEKKTVQVEVPVNPQLHQPNNPTMVVDAQVLDESDTEDDTDAIWAAGIEYGPDPEDTRLLDFFKDYRFHDNPLDRVWSRALPYVIGAGNGSFGPPMVDRALDVVVLASKFRDNALQTTWESARQILHRRLNPEPMSFSCALLLKECQVVKLLGLFRDGSIPIPKNFRLNSEDVSKELFPRLYIAEMTNLISGCMVGEIRVNARNLKAGFDEHPFYIYPPEDGMEWAYYSTGLYFDDTDTTWDARLVREKDGWKLMALAWTEDNDPEETEGLKFTFYEANGTGHLPFPPIGGWCEEGKGGMGETFTLVSSYGRFHPGNY